MKQRIELEWEIVSDILTKLKSIKREIRSIGENATEIRTNHRLQRFSTMDLLNSQRASKIIINIQKIDNIIKMWKIINCLTSNKTRNNLQTIDIPH